MIIRIAENRTVHLEDPENFRAFKVSVAGPATAYAEFAEANPRVLHFDDAATAWVSVEALRNWEGLRDAPAWQDGLSAMIEKARPYGWIAEDGQSIKAHVEWST
jgi:hypothetical protein